MNMELDVRPIGYWLKHLDALVEEAFERCFDGTDITRRHWQLLNAVRNGEPEDDRLNDDLVRNGWTTPDLAALTPRGEAVLATLKSKVDGVRATVTTGLTDQQYAATVSALEAMAANLEKARP
jgi:hypothetical protein